VDEFYASVGGLGGTTFAPGRAGANGNLATDDLLAILMGKCVDTGVDVMALFTTARMVESMLGHPVPGRAWRADYPELGWAPPV
jgi:hydroxymethylglutaryl-CoA lyase